MMENDDKKNLALNCLRLAGFGETLNTLYEDAIEKTIETFEADFSEEDFDAAEFDSEICVLWAGAQENDTSVHLNNSNWNWIKSFSVDGYFVFLVSKKPNKEIFLSTNIAVLSNPNRENGDYFQLSIKLQRRENGELDIEVVRFVGDEEKVKNSAMLYSLI